MMTPFTLSGDGTYLCTHVESGAKSYSGHHTVSICEFNAQPKLLSGRIWISGRPFLSLLIINIPMRGCLQKKSKNTISSLHSNSSIAYVMSGLRYERAGF